MKSAACKRAEKKGTAQRNKRDREESRRGEAAQRRREGREVMENGRGGEEGGWDYD